MPAYKNKESGKWYVVTQYTEWTGARKQKCKRGFDTRREALEWEQKFQQQSAGDLDMSFEAFVEIYTTDLKARLKESTWQTKEHIIQTKIVPYFGKRKINEITTKDVIAWQNELLAYRDEKHKPYSQSYLKTLHNQLSAIFNHAVRFYDLRSNPAAKAGNMGSEERKEMLFWTKEEYQKFAEEMMDKPISYYAFQMLYWTGIREGELLALTPADFDFERGTVKINKTYQRLKGKDVITSPKTKKSKALADADLTAAPVPIEKSADLEMDGRENFQISLCLWAAALKQIRLRKGCRSRRVLRMWVLHTSRERRHRLPQKPHTPSESARAMKILSCAFNMDTACVELKFDDGSMIAIDTIAVENEVTDNMYQRSELDYLIYNDPVAYAELILNGDPETYLKTVTEYKPLDS